MKWDEGDELAYARDQDLNKAGVVEPAKDWIDALEALQQGEGKEIPYASDEDEAGFVEPAKDWFDVLATMKWDEEDEAAYASEGDIKHKDTWTEFLSKVHLNKEGSWSPVDTVTALDVNRFTGRWYQVRGAGFRCRAEANYIAIVLRRAHVSDPCLRCRWCAFPNFSDLCNYMYPYASSIFFTDYTPVAQMFQLENLKTSSTTTLVMSSIPSEVFVTHTYERTIFSQVIKFDSTLKSTAEPCSG